MNRASDTYGKSPSILTYAQWEKQRERKGSERISEETTAGKVPILMKKVSQHIQKAQHTPSRISTKEYTPKHIILKFLKDKTHQNLWDAVKPMLREKYIAVKTYIGK